MLPDKNKAKLLNEGRHVASRFFNYGGFPKILKETQNPTAATVQFNEADDTKPSEEKIATQPDEVLWSDSSLVHRGYRYPSKALMDLAKASETGGYNARLALYSHPHYEEFRKGSPEFRSRPVKSATYHHNTRIDSSREGT